MVNFILYLKKLPSFKLLNINSCTRFNKYQRMSSMKTRRMRKGSLDIGEEIENASCSTPQYFSPKKDINQVKKSAKNMRQKESKNVAESVTDSNAAGSSKLLDIIKSKAKDIKPISTEMKTKLENISTRKTRTKTIKISYEEEEFSKGNEEDVKPLKPERKSPKKLDANDETGSPKKEKWEPPHWKQILDNLRQMRSKSDAPVDTMGCHKCADESVDEKTQRYHKLVALMLSSQTKDQVTYAAMARLKEKNLTPDMIVNINTTELQDLLMPVSFYKQKAKYLQKTAQVLIDQYDSDIPNTVQDLIKLPGVGPKMAHICMNTAWNIVTGIGVDVHVHRISNRLHWVRSPTKEPERTRLELEAWLPSEYWSEVNHLLVGFGQTICTPVNPKCGDCLNKDICPSANVKSKGARKK